jgi:hypothetical protein
VNLPAAQTIGTYAFNGCTSLASVTLPAAQTIGANAFYRCILLRSITLGQTPPALTLVESVSLLFTLCATSPSTTITFFVPSLAVYIGGGTAPWNDTDKVREGGVNSGFWGGYWDSDAATKGNLTVAIAEIP